MTEKQRRGVLSFEELEALTNLELDKVLDLKKEILFIIKSSNAKLIITSHNIKLKIIEHLTMDKELEILFQNHFQ